jgi:hypothetical protein
MWRMSIYELTNLRHDGYTTYTRLRLRQFTWPRTGWLTPTYTCFVDSVDEDVRLNPDSMISILTLEY